jgi:hypothetical protein
MPIFTPIAPRIVAMDILAKDKGRLGPAGRSSTVATIPLIFPGPAAFKHPLQLGRGRLKTG